MEYTVVQEVRYKLTVGGYFFTIDEPMHRWFMSMGTVDREMIARLLYEGIATLAR